MSQSKTQSVGLWAWFVCGLGALFYCYEYILRVSPSLVPHELMEAFNLNGAGFGNLSAFFYYAYTPMQLPVGLLMDRFGPRRLLSLAVLSCAGGALLFATAHTFGIAALGRFLIGFGSAFAFVGVLKLATIWLPGNRLGFISGLATTLGMLGAIGGDTLLTISFKDHGWRDSLICVSIAGLVLSLLIFTFVRDNSPRQPKLGEVELEVETLKDTLKGLYLIINNYRMWLISLCGCLLYTFISVFAEVWGVDYLRDAHHLSKLDAGITNSMAFFAWAIAGPIIGIISDKFQLRRRLLVVGSLFAALFMTIVLYVPMSNPFVLQILLFCVGIFTCVEVLTFAMARQYIPKHYAGTAVAFVNTMVMFGGMVLQPSVGALLDYFSKGAGKMTFTNSDFQLALATLPVAFLLSAIAASRIKNKQHKQN